MPKIITHLMFEGNAEDAMRFYISLFERSEIIDITRYGPNEAGAEGTVLQATFSLNGQLFKCIDSYVKHGFTFSPAISLYVSCDSDTEIGELFQQLSREGEIFMPLDSYPFSEKFAWIADRFGVSWQLDLAGKQERQ